MTNICQPFCRTCGDYHYLVDHNGNARACPRCSCPVCERLIDTHPDLGGCVCFVDPIRVNAPRLVVARSPIVHIPSLKD